MSKAAKNLSPLHSTPRWSSFNLCLVIFYLSCRITISFHSAEPLENCWIAKACRVDSMRLDGSAHTLAASNPIFRSIISLNVFNIKCDSLEHRRLFRARLRNIINLVLHSNGLCTIFHRKEVPVDIVQKFSHANEYLNRENFLHYYQQKLFNFFPIKALKVSLPQFIIVFSRGFITSINKKVKATGGGLGLWMRPRGIKLSSPHEYFNTPDELLT